MLFRNAPLRMMNRMRRVRSATKSDNRRGRIRAWGRGPSPGLGLIALGCVAVLMVVAAVGLVRSNAQEAFPLPAIDPPGAKATQAGAKAEPTGAQTGAQAGAPAGQQVAAAPSGAPSAAQAAPTPSGTQPAGTTVENADASEVAKQCSDLLKMATDLKAAVDKSSKDTLSVAAMRKAGQIEQFARKARTGGTEKR